MFVFDKLYASEVKDNNDPLKEGRVQIYIDLFMNGFDANLLPWARSFSNYLGGSSDFGESKIPEKDTKVWVWFEDEVQKKNPFFLTGIQLKNLNPNNLFYNNVQSHLTDTGGSLSSAQYPDVKFTYYKNGICVFVGSNTSAKEAGIYHSSDTFLFIDNSGKIYIRAGSHQLEKMVLGETLKDKLNSLLTDLQSEVHPTIFGPTGPPANASDYANIQSQLNDILSTNIKNN